MLMSELLYRRPGGRAVLSQLRQRRCLHIAVAARGASVSTVTSAGRLLERWTCLGVPDERPRGAAADLLRSLDQVGLEGLTVTAPRRVEHGDHLVVLLAEVAEVLVREVHDFSCRQRTPRQHIGVCSGCASQAKTEQAPLPWSSSFQTSSFLNGCTTSTTSRPGSAPLPS